MEPQERYSHADSALDRFLTVASALGAVGDREIGTLDGRLL